MRGKVTIRSNVVHLPQQPYTRNTATAVTVGHAVIVVKCRTNFTQAASAQRVPKKFYFLHSSVHGILSQMYHRCDIACFLCSLWSAGVCAPPLTHRCRFYPAAFPIVQLPALTLTEACEAHSSSDACLVVCFVTSRMSHQSAF